MAGRKGIYDPNIVLDLMSECEHDGQVAETLGVSRRTVARWRAHETLLNPWWADIIAIRLGYHPVEIWPNYYEQVAS